MFASTQEVGVPTLPYKNFKKFFKIFNGKEDNPIGLKTKDFVADIFPP